METKPGWKTTEFWLSLAVMIVGVVLASGAIVEGSVGAKILGGAMSVLSALGYTASRAVVKKVDTEAAAAKVAADAEVKIAKATSTSG